MEERNERTVHCMAVPPGLLIKEELAERGISQKSFAEMLGVQPSHLNEILKGKRSLAPIASKIEDVLHLSARTLIKMQASYEYDKKAIEERGIKEIEAKNELENYNKSIDIKTLISRLNIDSWKGAIFTLESLKQLLQLPCAARMQMNTYGTFFRKSEKTGVDERMIATWVLLARYEASQRSATGVFDKKDADCLKDKLVSIFNENKNVVVRTERVMSEYGIKFCVVPKVQKASVNGYCFLDKGVPAIVLTKRYDQIDHFAFDTMHELGHVLLHLDNDHFEMINIDEQENTSKEKEADRFASSTIIPDSLWSTAPAVKMNAFAIQKSYTEWAKQSGLHKWIVLGRVAHETGMHKFKGDDTRRIG